MKKALLSTFVLTAALFGAEPVLAAAPTAPSATARVTAEAPDPAIQLTQMARALKQNDLLTFMRITTPESKFAQLRAAYEMHRNTPATEKERAEFASKIEKLLAPNAVDAWMVEMEPQLAEARSKFPGAMLMGMGALQIAIASEDNKLTADQRQALRDVMPGLQTWLVTANLLNAQSMRQAATLITSAVRNSGVRTIDDLKALPFEQALSKAGNVMQASKQALKLYQLDIDAIIDSLRVQVVSITGDQARVRSTITLFGATISSEHELVLQEGRWIDKDVAVHIAEAQEVAGK